MKKFNFIIGKRQIMVSTLLLILAIAAYLNWLAAGDQSITVMDVLNPKKTDVSTQSSETETNPANTYGATELVGNQTTTDYFNQAKLQKNASHAEASDELNKLINSPDTPTDKRTEATNQALKLAEIEKQERSIENQVMAKGFPDCVAYVEKNNVNAIVKVKKDETNENQNSSETSENQNTTNDKAKMTEAQAAQIKDIIINVTNEKPYNIVVTPME